MLKPPRGCSCERPPDSCYDPCRPRPCHPPRPPRPEGVLLPQIVACEKRAFPCLQTCLTLCDLPERATPPLRLAQVWQSGARPSWTPQESACPDGRLHLCISIPICATVCDACGASYRATATVSVETSLCMPCPPSEWWRHCLYALACVRLVCAEPCTCGNSFQAQLHVSLELFLIRPEPYMLRRPACPDLPLYPPPIAPPATPCWPQSPAGPAPCGWPAQG